MKIKSLKDIIKNIEECDLVASNAAYTELLPEWALNDLVHAANTRKQNLIDQLRNAGIDIEA